MVIDPFCILHFTIRYTTWLSSGLAARKASDGGSSSPADAEWALSVPVEDFIYVCHVYNTRIPSVLFQSSEPTAFHPSS